MNTATRAIVLKASFLATVALGIPVTHAAPPVMLVQGVSVRDPGAAGGARTRFAIMRLPDGRFAFYDQNRPSAGPLTLPDRRGAPHTLLPHIPPDIAASPVIANSKVLANQQVILTPDKQVINVFVKGESLDKQTAARVGLPRYLNVWVNRASVEGAEQPHMIWRGYNGSQMEYQQLPSGRILVPFGSFQPHAKAVPPTGRHKTVVQYSDDGGRRWQESASKLVSPCYAGFNGSNEGACEPAIERLRDGRIWMLMRTQAGFLYESFSANDGTTWQEARASRFSTSTGPPNIMRHGNGWLVVTWNNCEMPPRHEGQGVYGGRDALHIAVSDDDGRTWRGFREIYLDYRRNDNPVRAGDRGTAYPLGAYTSDGEIVILAGQGAGGRNPIIVDPAWVVETESFTDFSDGLRRWSVYKPYGPAKRWWRARTTGCALVPNPTNPGKLCLQIRRADDLPGDGAVWNFPNGWKGRLTARVMIRTGFQGGFICLNDRFFDPTNDYGEQFAVFRTALGADGRIGNAQLQPGRWYDVTLDWSLSNGQCRLLVDRHPAGSLPLKNKTLNGISYIRFRSTSDNIDSAGFLVDRVNVSVVDPYAPACSPREQAAQEQRYVKHVVPLWQ